MTRTAAAAALATLTALAACSGGGTDAPAAGPTASPGAGIVVAASPDAGTVASPGESVSPNGAPPVGASEAGPTETTETDPAKTVAAFLDAVAGNDFAAQRARTTTAALAVFSIREIIRQDNARRSGKTETTVTVDDPPREVSTDDRRAEVAVRATVAVRVHGPEGEVSSTDTIAGPVILERTQAGWLIADMTYSGRTLAGSWFAVDGSETKEGIELVVGTLVSYKTTTAALVRLVNEAGDAAPLRIESAELVDAAGAAHALRQHAFDSTASPAGFLGFPRIDGKAKELRMTIARQDDGRRWSYAVPL